jgi:cysteine desulfurase
MLPYFTEDFGNAASRQHQFGWRAEAAVKNARKQVALLIGAEPGEIIFTSGATESINLALKGVAEAGRKKGNHIVTVSTEHKATLDTCRRLQESGFIVTTLEVDRGGQLSLRDVIEYLTPETILVSVMTANNEIGTIYPVEAIGEICRFRKILFHTDAAQAVGKMAIDVRKMNIDMMSLTSHKMYGPKGVGALFVREGIGRASLTPQIDGGGHERGLRSGTLNVPGIVGFGAAAHLAQTELSPERERIRSLRDRLVQGIMEQVEGVTLNGDPVQRLPGNVNLSFEGIRADELLLDLKDVAASTGSACSSANPEPSHVLKAIGLTDEQARSSIRFGVGRFNTGEEIDYVIGRVTETVKRKRKRSVTTQAAYP